MTSKKLDATRLHKMTLYDIMINVYYACTEGKHYFLCRKKGILFLMKFLLILAALTILVSFTLFLYVIFDAYMFAVVFMPLGLALTASFAATIVYITIFHYKDV